MKKKILFALALVMGIGTMAFADTQYPTMQLDGSGNVHGAWSLSPLSNGVYMVQTSHVSPFQIDMQSTWQNNTITHSGVLNVVEAPALAVNSNGDAVLFWMDFNINTQLYAYYVRIRPALTATWSSTTIINAPGSVLNDIEVKINDLGQVTAIFSAYTDPTQTNVAAYTTAGTVSNGNTWTGPTRISQ